MLSSNYLALIKSYFSIKKAFTFWKSWKIKWKTLFPPAGSDPGFSGWKSGILTIRPQELRQKKSKMKEISILISCLAHMWHTLPKNKLICPKMWGLRSQWNSAQMNNWHPWQLKKNQYLGAILELPAKQHCQFGLFGPFFR